VNTSSIVGSVCALGVLFLVVGLLHGAEVGKVPPAPGPLSILVSPQDDALQYRDFIWRNGRRPSVEVVDRIVRRAKEHPDDAEALYWAGQAGVDNFTTVANAQDLIHKSSDAGFGPAMVSHGVHLCIGPRNVRDVSAGLKLLEAARDKNEPTAFYQLGSLYGAGTEGVAKNPDLSLKLLHEAADKGVPRAYAQIARFYMSQGDMPKVLEFTTRAAECGDTYLLALLTSWYVGGNGSTITDPAKAVEWTRRGAMMEEPSMMRSYAYMLNAEYSGLKKDPNLSRRLLQRAAELGDRDAAIGLEVGRVEGLWGVTDERQAGLDALERLAAAEVHEAQFQLGRILCEGKFTAKDEVRGVKLVQQAADAEYGDAKEFLKERERAKSRKVDSIPATK